MAVVRTHHNAYQTHYHIVFPLKYRLFIQARPPVIRLSENSKFYTFLPILWLNHVSKMLKKRVLGQSVLIFDMDEDKKKNNNVDDVIPTDEEGNPLKRKESSPESEKRFDINDTSGRSDDMVDEEGDLKSLVSNIREKLKTALEEKQKYLENWQRDKADFLNARKRDRQAQEEFLKFAKEDIVIELLPVLQSFEMAFVNKETWEKVDKNWRVGVEYIYSQLKQVLETHDLKEVNPIGLEHDPLRDEAQEFVPVDNESDNNKILEVIQKGYELNGKLLRPPKVKVGEFKE